MLEEEDSKVLVSYALDQDCMLHACKTVVIGALCRQQDSFLQTKCISS